MVLLCRALAALVGFVLLLAAAVVGLAVAVFSLGGGQADFSLPGLARVIGLPALSDSVDRFIADLQGGSGAHAVAVLAGAGAVLLAIVLLIGALVPTRERLLVIRRDSEGTLAARRRAASQAVEALAEQPRDVSSAKARVRPYRSRPGGRLRVRVERARTADGDRIVKSVRERVAAFGESASLRVRVRDHVPRRGGRVR